jgi:enamine deaminase RidA (YjgF/YER057c/UK114 family)
MSAEKINPKELLSWPTLAHVVISPSGRLAHIAGQTAYDKKFELIGETLYDQTMSTVKHLQIALAAAGASPEDVVSSTVYIAGLNHQTAEDFNRAFTTSLNGQSFPPHALTLVGVQSFVDPKQLIEISAVAAIP